MEPYVLPDEAVAMTPPLVLPHPVLFGAAYYHEYQPYERLQTDMDLMAAAGFTVIRVGESVWSTWEPEEGVFDLDWLEPVLDAAHQRGISAVVGTPTYAVPPWLRRRYPETAAERATGAPIPYGHRQNADITHPTFLRLAERVVRNIVGRYAGHPAVIGWQVDNEPGMEILHNQAVFERFVAQLRDVHGDVATVNERWGLTYWSHRISSWDELWGPHGNTTPAYDAAWRRFQADLTTEFIAWQVSVVRDLARDDQFVTTCLALNRPAQDPSDVAAVVDVTAANLYYPMQDALTFPAEPSRAQAGRPSWIESSGTWSIYLQADRSRGLRDEAFLVTETNASSIGESHVNYPAFDGQWRQAAWALVARGSRMVEYWHWHTLHFGNETYWGGVLGHSLEPGRCYNELARVGRELKTAGAALEGLRPDAPVAVLVDVATGWAFEFQPPTMSDDGVTPEPHPYERMLGAWYEGLFRAGLQTDIVTTAILERSADQLVRRWPVLVVPSLYLVDDEPLAALAAYAEAGGHLVVGPRTGYAHADGRLRHEVMPGRLRDGVGASYLEFSNITGSIALKDEGLAGPGSATRWADGLRPEGAQVLASYDHPHFSRWAAVTTNQIGRGRVTYVGTIPDRSLASTIATWIGRTSLPPDPWAPRPESVTVTGATTAAGKHVTFLSNWSWQSARVNPPIPVRDLLADIDLDPAQPVMLGPWDVRVLAESTDQTPARTPRHEGDHT
jgi:beta-galactosidase